MTMPSTMSGSDSTTLSSGETLQEILADQGISRLELAARLGLSLERISAMITGEELIMPEVALQLAHIFGRSAKFFQS